MAASIIWSPEAIEDIEAIASYIERDSPWYAAAVVSRLIETTDDIRIRPSMGRIVPEVKRRHSENDLFTAIDSSLTYGPATF
jgi:toxin ParE1/3/4